MKDTKKTEFSSVTVESCEGGWIIREKGQETIVKFQWDRVVRLLEERLTSKWIEKP